MSDDAMTNLRSLLFVPGNQARMLEKATRSRPGAYVPDLEDSVPHGEKQSARERVARALPALGRTGLPVIPRVNALDSGLLQADLEAVVGRSTTAISIGKVGDPSQIEAIDLLLRSAEAAAGIEIGVTRLVLWIETALAVVRCHEICSASPRIAAVAFGAEDFSDDMGIPRPEDDAEFLVPRSVTCIAARAAGIAALDGPYFAFRDDEGLRANALASRRLGFTGKFAIHPDQIQSIDLAFRPSEREIEEARRVIEAFEAAEREGRGSTSLDGKVVDIPVVKRARALVAGA